MPLDEVHPMVVATNSLSLIGPIEKKAAFKNNNFTLEM